MIPRSPKRPVPRPSAELTNRDCSTGRLADALTYCDMTTGPDGKPPPVDVRPTEIQERYGPEHVVSRAIHRAAPRTLTTVRMIGAEMARQTSACRCH